MSTASSPSSTEISPSFYTFVSRGATILDLGCGCGKSSIQLAQKGYEVHGIDINEESVRIAVSNARELGIQSVSFRVADASCVSYEDERFDAVVMQALLTMVPEKTKREEIIREAHRVLKPEGYLYIQDFLIASNVPLYKERYIQGVKEGLESGSFKVFDESGKFLYIAHHFSESEINTLVSSFFSIRLFNPVPVITRSGNHITGFVLIAQKD